MKKTHHLLWILVMFASVLGAYGPTLAEKCTTYFFSEQHQFIFLQLLQ